MKALVLTLRGCHLGYMGCYGNTWIATPVLDRLAAEGVVFDRQFADVPDAEAARLTWRDGRRNFPTAADKAEAIPPFDLLETLRAAGIATVLVADGSHPVAPDFARGWDECEIVQGEGASLEQTLELAREAVEQLAGREHWLLWVDLATLLPPWNAPADFSDPYFQVQDEEEESEKDVEQDDDEEEDTPTLYRAEEEDVEDPLIPWNDPSVGPINTEDDIDFCRLQASFAGPMSYLDAGIGVLIEELERHSLTKECLILVTGDHGLPLGEHGFVGPYRPWLHDELVHLPLILRWPESLPSGHRVSGLTQSVDVAPTLLSAFGLPLPSSLEGHDLLPLARRESESARAAAFSALRIGAAMEASVRTAEWAYLHPLCQPVGEPARLPSLFVKPDDRWEVNNVVQHHHERAEEMERLLREQLSAGNCSPSESKLSEERNFSPASGSNP